jgi:hypothetical protein
MHATRLLALLAALIGTSYTTTAFAYSNTSRFGIHVGFDESDNVYLFCSPYTITRAAGASSDSVKTRFRRVLSDATATDAVVTSLATTQARIQCFKTSAHSGTPVAVIGNTNEGNDQSTAACPTTAPFGAYAECRVLSNLDVLQQPYVYRATACGDGIASVSSQLLGQVTGKQGDPNRTVTDQNGTQTGFFYNDTVTPASVGGTDEGVPFFSGGRMYFAFGDSFLTNGTVVHNTLAKSSTVAPFFGGYFLGEWYGTSASDTVADQPIVPTMPDEMQCHHVGMIPSGGFSVTEAGTNWKFLWFMSVATWNYNPATNNWCDLTNGTRLRVNRGSLAFSFNGSGWGRLDAAFPNGGAWWSSIGNFTNTFAYHQIIGSGSGYIYLYGFAADNNMPDSNSGVYLARVRARVSNILDKSSYEYWDGLSSTWKPNDEWAATPLVGIAQHARELSVSFNSYANRYMMLVTDTSNGMRIYQSETLQGPWSVVGTLPGVFSGYAALTHDRFQSDQGKNFGYFMSQFIPYNVGDWWATVTRNKLSNCTPGDP